MTSSAASAISGGASSVPASASSNLHSRIGAPLTPPTTTLACWQMPRSSRVTAAAASTTAKSPRRRLTSWKLQPVRPTKTGNLTSVSSSSGSRAVVRWSRKNSSAWRTRIPRTLCKTSSTSRVAATRGCSPEGSAWAMLPPMVPRLRMAGWPTKARASLKRPQARLTSSEAMTRLCRVAAPIAKTGAKTGASTESSRRM